MDDVQAEMQRTAISRRDALRVSAGLAASIGGVQKAVDAAEKLVPHSAKVTGMGLVIYDCNIRRRWMKEREPNFDLHHPLHFIKHCQSLGAGGMQAVLGGLPKHEAKELREFCERTDMYLESIVRLPKNEFDVSRFAAEIQVAADCGALAARTTVIPGRRYEQFQTLEGFRNAESAARSVLELAAPIVEKNRMPLAVENHKDQRIDERIELFEHIGSEFVGACLDTGNSFALLDGAYEPIEALAPYAFSVHLKDQALQGYPKGFLLGDIPLGQGSFDLKRMVKLILKHKPQARFSLELITRDPLQVPCLTEGFFDTLPDVTARDLVSTMRFVDDHAVDRQQHVSSLPLEQQVQLEDANVRASLKYAGDVLKI